MGAVASKVHQCPEHPDSPSSVVFNHQENQLYTSARQPAHWAEVVIHWQQWTCKPGPGTLTRPQPSPKIWGLKTAAFCSVPSPAYLQSASPRRHRLPQKLVVIWSSLTPTFPPFSRATQRGNVRMLEGTGWRVELETKVQKVFTITEKDPTQGLFLVKSSYYCFHI